MSDLIERRLKTSDPAIAPVIVAARPAAFRREMLDWNLRWLPGMEASPPRYAVVQACTSREPGSIIAYGVHYGQDTAAPGSPKPKDIEQQRDAEILGEYKTHPGLGPSQIVNQLRRKGIKVPTRVSIGRRR